MPHRAISYRVRVASTAAIAALTFALGGFALGGCARGPAPAAEFVAQADRLHDASLASSVATDRDLDEYINEVGRRVIAGATAADPAVTRDPVLAHMHFHLVGSLTINAFDTGGGHIYIYRGLFQLCQNEEELAAILAHEYAHAVSLDVEKTGMKAQPAASLDRIVSLYVQFPFSSRQELDADKLGFTFYERGGWDPAKFADLFDRLRALDVTPDGRPSFSERAAAIRALASRRPDAARDWRQPTVADAQTFRDLRARAVAFSGEQTDSSNRAYLYLRCFPNCFLPASRPEQKAAQSELKRDLAPANNTTPEPS